MFLFIFSREKKHTLEFCLKLEKLHPCWIEDKGLNDPYLFLIDLSSVVVMVSQLDVRFVSLLLFEFSQGAAVPIMLVVLGINITRMLNKTETKIQTYNHANPYKF